MGNVDEKIAIHNEVVSWHSQIGGSDLFSNDKPIIDDLPSLIRACRSADLLVAVCTSDDRKSTDTALARWDIASLVDYSICGDEVPNNGKPSAHPLLELCRRAKVMPQECIVVGDTVSVEYLWEEIFKSFPSLILTYFVPTFFGSMIFSRLLILAWRGMPGLDCALVC
jgi:hypothetical protein